MRLLRYKGSAAAFFVTISSAAFAQTYVHYFLGTGFFVSRAGNIVTNAHVVRNCADITLRGDFGTEKAELVAIEPEKDLALLRTSVRPAHIAILHGDPQSVAPGDRVQMLGYPEEYGVRGEPLISESVVSALYGPSREPQWMQFRDSARHGNSGGPLIDLSGDVIGVVTAKAYLTYSDPYSPHGQRQDEADIAITLPVLRAFLDAHYVTYQQETQAMGLSDQRIRMLAENYSVEILCRQRN